jgi:hypothetical protein
MKIYVVTMYRWGDKENHSYVIGAYVDDMDKAVRAGEDEYEWRGHKYDPEVVCFDHSTDPPTMTVVKSLESRRPPINTSFIRNLVSKVQKEGVENG